MLWHLETDKQTINNIQVNTSLCVVVITAITVCGYNCEKNKAGKGIGERWEAGDDEVPF